MTVASERAHAKVTDDAQLWRRPQEPGVDRRRASDEQRISVSEIGTQRLGGAPRARVNRPAGLGAKEIHRGGRQGVRDEDLQRVLVEGPIDRM